MNQFETVLLSYLQEQYSKTGKIHSSVTELLANPLSPLSSTSDINCAVNGLIGLGKIELNGYIGMGFTLLDTGH